jgi:hypothetical protein
VLSFSFLRLRPDIPYHYSLTNTTSKLCCRAGWK